MLIVGLTGSVGMGKTTVAQRLRELGIAVFDADAEVHRLYAGPLAPKIETAFPGTTTGGIVDRTRLSAHLVNAPQDFARLEAIVHPAVRAGERTFLHEQSNARAAIAVLEIPLLLEARSEYLVDVVVVVSADAETQRRRVMERPGMSAEKLDALLRRQMPDDEKRRRAHFVVDTSKTIPECHAQVDTIVARLESRRGTAFERHWLK